MAMEPSQPGTLYIGGYGLIQSKDYGVTWYTKLQVPTGTYINTIAVAPSKPGVVYYATRDSSGATVSIYNDTDGTTQTILPTQTVSIVSIAVDPNNPLIAYAVLHGRDAGGFRLSYEGGTWKISQGVGPFGLNINVIKISPDSSTILVGTDKGAYYSTDGGVSWNLLGVGLPNVAIADMAIVTTVNGNTETDKLIAGTYGRGAWSFDLGTRMLIVPVFSISASPNALSVGTGAVARSTITISAVQGVVGQVTLSVDNSACTITPNSTSGSGSAVLSCTFTTARTVIVTVTGTGVNQSRSTIITFTVSNGAGGGGGTGGGPKGAATLDLPQVAIGVAVLIVLANWVGGVILATSLAFKRRRQGHAAMR